jgi:protoheme IX farnesyltransferase
MTSALAPARAAAHPLVQLRDILLLSKPRLSSLVMLTCAGGIWLAPGGLAPARAVLAVLATAAVVGAANSLNCYLERDLDGLMRRTRDRPLPAGRLDPLVAVGLGVVVPAFAVPVLALAAGPLTAGLALLALLSYVLVYTPLKRRTPLALFVGTLPGAIPPAMGWTTVTGRLDAGALALFAVLAAWQLPHFLAVSLYLEDDYARAGLPVFARVHGGPATRRAILAATAVLAAASFLPLAAGVVRPGYALPAGALGLALLAYAAAGQWVRGVRGSGPRGGHGAWARGYFRSTLAYLTALLAVLAIFRVNLP